MRVDLCDWANALRAHLTPDDAELNGAVEFTHEYQPAGDVFADVASELARHAVSGLVSLEAASTAA